MSDFISNPNNNGYLISKNQLPNYIVFNQKSENQSNPPKKKKIN